MRDKHKSNVSEFHLDEGGAVPTITLQRKMLIINMNRQDDTNVTEVEIVTPLDAGQRKVVDAILVDVENGMTESDAATLNKCRMTWHRWKKEHPELQDEVDEARIRYKRKMITAVNINSARSGKTALEVLRRQYPAEWNVPQKIEHEGRVDLGMDKIAETLQKIYQESDEEEETADDGQEDNGNQELS